jgi:hypothetical protein
MSTPNFLINSYINDCNGDCEQLCKVLFKQGILSKQYSDDNNLMIVYNKFDDSNMTDLKRECRSLVLDMTTLKIKAYSCETPLLNFDRSKLQDTQTIINECYEGTLLSVFYHNDEWYVSTRRCLRSTLSVYNIDPSNVTKSHYQMFEEVLGKAGFANFDNFSRTLDVTKSYYFVLIHHENKHIIDYTSKFEIDYGFLCLVSIKDADMVEQNLYESIVPFISEYIFLPKKYDSIDEFITLNNQNKYDKPPCDEGLVVKIYSPETCKYTLHKLQTDAYKLALAVGNGQNMYKGLIHLYQTNRLVDYFNQNPTSSFIKIINPLNTYETFFSTGVVDSTFKVCTSELFELFKILWSLKTGKSQNKELYELLPNVYKEMMYGIRGLYYKKKAILFENTNDKTSEELRNSHLTINDIYSFLKKLPIDTLIDFLKLRRLMFNWVSVDKTSVIKEFGKVSALCNSLHLKQCAIFTNKLHPNITYSDFPSTKKE